jgi:hypothetical protein
MVFLDKNIQSIPYSTPCGYSETKEEKELTDPTFV